MSILFLVDQLRSSFASGQRTHVQWSPLHKWAVIANMLVIALSFFAIYTTSVYFHTPVEKLSGFVIGVAGFYATQLQFSNTHLVSIPSKYCYSPRGQREATIQGLTSVSLRHLDTSVFHSSADRHIEEANVTAPAAPFGSFLSLKCWVTWIL
ncbi:hypothetical protein A0H81_11838 [Grifola frondosa]|uniref:Uncharacterized protein n=1 Tax=Grifola frondosa TaxID=5627 RepID=A0A1C7LVN2_GRIFR|nr:hypothetical protein A0H81_11838 [Grifola frondosa]